jgi:REP-associated tyrosine transposase
MARQPRLDIADVCQHAIQRGNNRQLCFSDEFDRQRYLDLLGQMAARYDCAIHAYVLMTNHVHLLATPKAAGSLSRMMQGIGRLYVAEFNRRHDRTGTLWEGRYKSCLVDTDAYVLACYRYIELNPVRAGLVTEPSVYRWSSHRVNVGCEDSALLQPHGTYLALGRTREARRAAYLRLFGTPLSGDQLRDIRVHTQQQRAFGTERFQAMVAATLGRSARPRPVGRPSSPGQAL